MRHGSWPAAPSGRCREGRLFVERRPGREDEEPGRGHDGWSQPGIPEPGQGLLAGVGDRELATRLVDDEDRAGRGPGRRGAHDRPLAWFDGGAGGGSDPWRFGGKLGKSGAGTVRGSFVGVAAPGEGLNTTFGAFGDCVVGEAPTSGYAAALTAATAALVAQRFPDAGPAMWKYRIESAAIRPVSDQHDPALGWGLLSPYDALTLTLDTARPGPTAPGSVREVLPVAVVAADPIAVAPDPLDDSRRLGLWLGGIALAGALALRMIRSLRAR